MKKHEYEAIVYNHEFGFRKFVGKYPELTGDMTDCLIGNLLRDFEMLRSAMPDALPHGLPLVAA